MPSRAETNLNESKSFVPSPFFRQLACPRFDVLERNLRMCYSYQRDVISDYLRGVDPPVYENSG